MNRKNHLSIDCVLNIEKEFLADVPGILGSNLVFAFIFGGVAKGYANHDHDIDMFFCVEDVTKDATRRHLREWYFYLHENYDLPADSAYPGEITVPRLLDEKIDFLEGRRLRLLIETQYEYEAILWADALSGPKRGRVGDLERLAKLEYRCTGLASRWRQEIRDLTCGSEAHSSDVEEVLDLRRLFKRAGLKYLKLGDNSRPADKVDSP